MSETAIIVGAGPAGLTAAHELLERTNIRVIVLEQEDFLGGISRTVNYKGNRMDIGGHRFFSKSDRVMKWWEQIMPLDKHGLDDPMHDRLLLPTKEDPLRMLERQRVSRIYYRRKFFDYPVRLNANTAMNLGPLQMGRIGASYLKARAFPRPSEASLEDFFINRFGEELYRTFFKDYTEKVWGLPCSQLKPEWGAQRIKGLSVTAVLLHALREAVSSKMKAASDQKNVETSLIERFWYPKYGPGQLWEEVASRIQARGAQVIQRHQVSGVTVEGGRVRAVQAIDAATGEKRTFPADYVFSTMPICELVEAMGGAAPEDVHRVARGLRYRDFVTVGLLVPRLKIRNATRIPTRNEIVPDNWIYVQESAVKLGRLQLFQNWSPYMVEDLDKVWMGLEYFCNEGDELWRMTDPQFLAFAAEELASIGIIDQKDVLDGTVVRVRKTYPVYFGSYEELPVVRSFVDAIDNLFLVGRNGLHRYNNADHSMLTAMTAVDNIVAGRRDKANIWQVNTEQEYHEEKK